MAETDFEKLKGDKKIPTGILYKRAFQYLKKELPALLISILLVLFNISFDIVTINGFANEYLFKL